MTLSACFEKLKNELKQGGVEDFLFESYCLFKCATGFNRQYLVCRSNDALEIDKLFLLNELVKRRIGGEPLQYIIGEWDFCDLTFKVGEGVLIPRPETEILVEIADEFLKDRPQAVVFDLCAGTGAVGFTVASHNPEAKVYLFEKYPDALNYLKKNADGLKLLNASIIECDILNDAFDDEVFPDIILSNPPYIKSNEIDGLQKEVQKEPATALDGGKDGLLFYRAIYEKWFTKIKEGGSLIMECGDGQSSDIMSIFKNGYRSKNIIYDFNNIDRVVQINV